MKRQFDVIVIGGGVNGCGVARDLALRGVKVLLLDKGDLSMGTSWASSGMIHGGIRYLLSDVSTTRKSCTDAGYIMRIAPHLIFRIPMVYPVLKEEGLAGRVKLEGATALFSVYDHFQPLKGGMPHQRLTVEELKRIVPDVNPEVIGGVVTDEWGIDVPRLCVANALHAVELGAKIRTWSEVTNLLMDGKTVTGVRWKDVVTGRIHEASSTLVINCAGPWAPKIAAMAGAEVKLRPAKGVHLVLDRRIGDIGVLASAIDGRQVFVIPHENGSLIGTTDDDYYGDPDELVVTEDEIAYLFQAVERSLPGIRGARVVKTIAGLRPTLFEADKYEDDLTRDHRVYDHKTGDGVHGFVTLAGGKLAAYRVMAEETADLACRKLRVSARCVTHTVPLPGGGEQPDATELAKEFGIDPYAVRRLIFRQGNRARDVLELVREEPRNAALICDCEPVMEAEIRYCIRHEMVRRPVDLIGRCRISEGPCQGYGCLMQAALIFGDERGLSHAEVMNEAAYMLQEKWKWRRPVLTGAQLAVEDLYRMVHQAVLDPKGVSTKEVF